MQSIFVEYLFLGIKRSHLYVGKTNVSGTEMPIKRRDYG